MHVAAQPSHSASFVRLSRMKISELAERAAVSVHRLRRYEDAGLIQAERTDAGYRVFSESTVRDVIFVAMSRDLGFSLKEIGDALPRYRARTLTFDQLIDIMRGRITKIDAEIAAQRALRLRIVKHIAWVQQRQRAHAKRRTAS